MSNQKSMLTLQVTDGVAVGVIQDPQFEFLMSTKDVALGYGVAEATIRSHKNDQKQELIENQHFVSSVGNSNARENLQSKTTYWTKAGVIRLGMFIRSERAKLFRDWAERVILAVTAPVVTLPPAKRRNHNRITQARLVEILAEVARIEDRNLRLSLLSKLMPEEQHQPNAKQVASKSGMLELDLGQKGGASW